MKLEETKTIADEIVAKLSPYCQRISVVGSIRQGKPVINDIDIALIPSDRQKLDLTLTKMGDYKIARVVIVDIQPSFIVFDSFYSRNTDVISLDIYIAVPENWGTKLLMHTGSMENIVRLANLAKEKGWYLPINGDGLFNEKGEMIASDSEEAVYQALDSAYQRPEERG